MDKPFYISGFLYNLKTQQILLQSEQKDDVAAQWSMIGGEGQEGEDAQAAFQRIIQEKLHLELKPKCIYPIYDYFHEKLAKVNYVVYAEVGKAHEFEPMDEATLAWVTFSDTVKMPFSGRTQQDVVVGERVINLKVRLDEELKNRVNEPELSELAPESL